MTYLELFWACLHPWYWIGGLATVLGFGLFTISRWLGYLLVVGASYPYYLGLQQGCTQFLQVETDLNSYPVALIETCPYILPVVIVAGALISLRKIRGNLVVDGKI